MDRNSTAYTFGYAAVMMVIVAVLLAYLATALKPLQRANQELATKGDILKSVGLADLPKDSISMIFDQSVEAIVLDEQGNPWPDAVDVFQLDIGKESKVPADKRKYPLFIYEGSAGKRYIIPLYGNGLWDKIWGYVALKENANTIAGVSFDHKAETPGLGAEIKDNPQRYNEPYVGKNIFNDSGDFVSVNMVKGKKTDPEHQIDAISGATITSNGVNDMMYEDIASYLPYLTRQTGATEAQASR